MRAGNLTTINNSLGVRQHMIWLAS